MIESEKGGVNAIANEIRELVHGASIVEPVMAQSLLRRVAEIHGVDGATYHWWKGLSDAHRLFYGDALDDWSREIRDLLCNVRQKGVYLAVTDDEPPPWPVLWINDPSCIVELLEKMHFFEYFVFSPDCSRVFFDTHDNVLVSSTGPE